MTNPTRLGVWEDLFFGLKELSSIVVVVVVPFPDKEAVGRTESSSSEVGSTLLLTVVVVIVVVVEGLVLGVGFGVAASDLQVGIGSGEVGVPLDIAVDPELAGAVEEGKARTGEGGYFQ